MLIAKTLEKLYPNGLQQAYREEILRVCSAFIKSGFADSKFEGELTSGSKSKFWSCLSEALIFDRICRKQFAQRPMIGIGPDFFLIDEHRKVWVEVVCPEPVGLSKDWIEIQSNAAGFVPHDAILLRWTSAIKAKAEKLIGGSDENNNGYLKTGIVAASDIYVIAVNGCQLRHGPFPALHGISQFPYAVEAVFPIGPYQIRIDAKTLQSVGHGYQERYSIPKPNGATISSCIFLDPRFRMVSAIWAVDFNGSSVLGNQEPSALIHNPNASNRLPEGFLPSDSEYVATPTSDGDYLFGSIE